MKSIEDFRLYYESNIAPEANEVKKKFEQAKKRKRLAWTLYIFGAAVVIIPIFFIQDHSFIGIGVIFAVIASIIASKLNSGVDDFQKAFSSNFINKLLKFFGDFKYNRGAIIN